MRTHAHSAPPPSSAVQDKLCGRNALTRPLIPGRWQGLAPRKGTRPYTNSPGLEGGSSPEFSGGLFLGATHSQPRLALPLPRCVTLRVTWPLGASIFSSVKWGGPREKVPLRRDWEEPGAPQMPPPPAGYPGSLPPTPDPASDSAPTNPPAAPSPPASPGGGGVARGRALFCPAPRPLSLTHSWDPWHGARTRPGRRHLRALPPAGLAAAAAPACSPRRGPASRRPAPAPRPPPPLPSPPSPARGSAPPAAPPPPGAPSRPARGGPCGSLTPPLPRRPGGQGRGLGLRHPPRRGWASGGQASRDVEGATKPRALSPHPDAPMPPALPGVGRRKPGGAGSGLRWGRGAPPSPRPGFLFSRQTVPTGLTGPGAGRLPAGRGGAQTW